MVIYDDNKLKLYENKYFIGIGSNNRAEYIALIYLLYSAYLLGIKNIITCSDSKLIVEQMNGGYRVKDKNILQLYLLSKSLTKQFENIKISHIRRGYNSYADSLANKVFSEYYDTNNKTSSE